MGYTTVENLRAEGVPDPPSDGSLTSLVALVSRYIDRITGMWFERRDLTLALDGSGSPVLSLPAPALSITSVKIDGHDVGASEYRNYNRRPETGAQDFWSPRLVFVDTLSSRLERSVYFLGRPSRQARWPWGQQNVEVVGSFGFVEPDGTTTPPGIVRLANILAIGLSKPLAQTVGKPGAFIQSETFGNYSYSLSEKAMAEILGSNVEAAQLLENFRRVPEMASV